MPTESSIQMKIKNGSDWELLYPYTKAELVKNLNNFSSISINGYSIEAGSCKETLNIIAGDNINIVPNNITKSITISSTSSGNGLSVTEEERNYWNLKEDSTAATLKLQESKTYAKEYADSQISLIQIPNRISLLENDLGYATESYVKNKIIEAQFSIGEVDIDLSGYATKDDLLLKAEKTHTHDSLHTHSNKSILDNISTADLQRWDNKSSFSGNYNDLIGKPVIPSYTSQLNKDDVYDKTTINTMLTNKVDKVTGKILSTNDFTTAYKTKLEGLFNYIHPDNSSIRHVTDDQISYWNNKSDRDVDVDYNTLINKPSIPARVSDLINDMGFISSNHTHTEIGTIGQLNTSIKTNLVEAINEVLVKINSLSTRIENIENELMANVIRTSNADGITTNTGDVILYR